MSIKRDLVDVNASSGRFRPPSRAELDAFRDALRLRLPMPVALRFSGGHRWGYAKQREVARRPEKRA